MITPQVDVGWQGQAGEPVELLAAVQAMALELLQLTNLQQELRATIGDSVAQLSVVLTDDAHIQPLNHRWRGVNRATDVLSFPMGEGGLLGDIVISVETARRRLRPEDWELQDELLFLLIHGLLHLLGYDHMEAAERREMEAAEQRLWTALGRVGTLRAAQS